LVQAKFFELYVELSNPIKDRKILGHYKILRKDFVSWSYLAMIRYHDTQNSISGKVEDSYLLYCVQTGSRAHVGSYTMDT
jgi:hypothetical protein